MYQMTSSYSRTATTKKFITIHIIVELVQRIALIQAVVVERNLHSYYRLPLGIGRSSNGTAAYHILQCPFRSGFAIPKPKEMGICVIVGRFTEHKGNLTDSDGQFAKNQPQYRYTKVNYHPRKPQKFIKVIKVKTVPQHLQKLRRRKHIAPSLTTPDISPQQSNSSTYSQRFIKKRDQIADVSNGQPVNYLQPRTSTTSNKNRTLRTTNNSSHHEQSFSEEILNPSNYNQDIRKEEVVERSPLRYLGVEDAIKILKLHQPLPNSTFSDSEKFFADLKNYTRGFQSKGFHNIFHRDEVFNDHIFYDDLQQAGNYRQHGKYHENL